MKNRGRRTILNTKWERNDGVGVICENYVKQKTQGKRQERVKWKKKQKRRTCLSGQCTCYYFFYPPSHWRLFSSANSPSKHQEWIKYDKLMSLLSQLLHLACLIEGQNLPIAKFIQLCCSLSLVTTSQLLQVHTNFHGISTNAHVQ